MKKLNQFEAIVIGVSAGGMEALRQIFKEIPEDFELPILVVQHLHAESDSFIVQYLDKWSQLKVKEAEDKEEIQSGYIYIAPPNYHLLVEKDRTCGLSIDHKVNYSRPSIDVLFDSAAQVYQEKLIGIILTGANNDGTDGMQTIREKGGLLIVQDPKTAEVASMPMSVIHQMTVDYILNLEEIAPFLAKVN